MSRKRKKPTNVFLDLLGLHNSSRCIHRPPPSASMMRWSSPKDASLETALRRNCHWVVNSQIKRLLLRFSSRTAHVRFDDDQNW